MIQLMEPCEKRPVRFMELFQFRDWRVKVYSIAYKRDFARSELVDSAKELALSVFPEFGQGNGRYGVGYLGVHDGRGENFVFADWWQDENELHHHVFTSPSESPEDLIEKTSSGVTACIWDLRVQCFERNAWVDKVLRNPAGPNLDAYLSTVLNEDA